MNLRNIKLDELSKFFFAEGWFFFVPYLFFYLVFKYLHFKIYYLENLFIFLHVFNGLLFIYYWFKVYKKKHLSQLLFWLCLILIFQIPGAYLEFPSDAWEHFRRIFEWQSCTFVDHHSTNYKFTYFWGWTLMSRVEPLARRTALNIYSTFWQILLAYQFYLFALRIGFSETWTKVQVLGTIGLFGTNVFGFYRYYALSSTPLAYIAYLQSLIVILDGFDGKKKKLIALIFLLPLIYYNHYQELLLLIISTLAIFIVRLYEKKRFDWKKVSIILVLSFIAGALAVKFLQQYATIITHFGSFYFPDNFKGEALQNLSLEPTYWSKWGILRIWNPKLPYFQTLGIFGYFSMIFSLIFWNKYRVLATLTLFPFLLLLFSPFTLFFSTIITDSYTTFRILYAFPSSFMLVVGLKEIAAVVDRRFLKRYNYIIITFFLICLSFQPNLPWRGRLWHQFYKTPAQLSLENLDVTAQWFFKNRNSENQYVNAQEFLGKPRFDYQCLFVTDNATGFSLGTHLGLVPNNRLLPYNPSQSIKTVEELQPYIQSKTQQKPCSFLVGIPDRINVPPISKVGQMSEHWDSDIVRQDFNYNKEFLEVTTEVLTALEWTKTFVPPFYWLYEDPSVL